MSEPPVEYKVNANGTKPTDKPKRKQRSAGIPQLQALNSMQSIGYRAYIEPQATDWGLLQNYDFFSPSEDGSNLMMKITKSKALDIKSQKPMVVTFGRAYRVHLESNPIVDEKAIY